MPESPVPGQVGPNGSTPDKSRGSKAVGRKRTGSAVPAESAEPALLPMPAPRLGPNAAAVAAIPASGDASGPELARAVLDAARAKRAERFDRSRTERREGASSTGRRPRGYSGSGPDPRDPQTLGSVLEKLVKARGWQKPAAEARIFGMWPAIVGEDLASHSRPVKLENGELTVEAESTAWATQLRLLTGKLLTLLAKDVGRDVVKKLHVHGPVAPSWAKGPKRVRGRGPRDTYG